LSFETEFEVKYAEIGAIVSRRKLANIWQVHFGLFTAAILPLLFTTPLFSYLKLTEHPSVIIIGKVAFLIAIGLIVPGLVKENYYRICNKDYEFLTYIRINSKNMDYAVKALDMVKGKNARLTEINAKSPFAETEPVYELIQHDFPYFMHTSTTAFYETYLVNHEINLISEDAIKISYANLNQDISRVKQGNGYWSSTGWYLIFTGGVIQNFSWALSLSGIACTIVYNVFWILLVLGIISFFLCLIKEEQIVLHNKKGRSIYSMKITRKNKEKLEEILEFVKAKIPPEQETNSD
jgi:hypothetical protein